MVDAEEEEETSPSAQSNEPPVAVAPIWAAFWSRAVADIAGAAGAIECECGGCSGDRYGLSWTEVGNMDDP